MIHAKKFHVYACAAFVACLCLIAPSDGEAAPHPDTGVHTPGTAIVAKIRLDQSSNKQVRKLTRIEPGTNLGSDKRSVPCNCGK